MARGPLEVEIIDGLTPKIKMELDALTGNLPVISRAHHRTHEGELYRTYHKAIGIANSVTTSIYIRPSLTEHAHVSVHVDAEGKALVDIYEAQTTTAITATGTSLTPINRNRTSTNSTTMLVTHTPTWTTTGMINIHPEIIPGGAGGLASGSETQFDEMIFAAGKEYVVTVDNQAGAAKDVGIGVRNYTKAV